MKTSFSEYLAEASLGRFYQHLMGANDGEPRAIFILTASRASLSPSQNKTRNADLRRVLRAIIQPTLKTENPVGFFKVVGTYAETQDNGETRRVREDSTVVVVPPVSALVSKMKKAVLTLGAKFDQDSVFVAEKGQASLVYTRDVEDGNGNIAYKKGHVTPLGAFHPQALGMAFTKIKGKTFAFDWIEESFDESESFDDLIEEYSEFIECEEKESTIAESLKVGKDGKYIPIEIGKDGKYHPETRFELNILLYQEKIDASLIDVTKITDFSNIFSLRDLSDFPNLKGISKWDVSRVKQMSFAFEHSKNIPDLSKWNVSKVEDMEGMFAGSDFNGDISKWNVSNVDNFYSMFAGSNFNGDVSKWKIKGGADIDNMFKRCPLEKNPSLWMSIIRQPQKVDELKRLLFVVQLDPRKIDISKITDFTRLFSGIDFNKYPTLKGISEWDTSHVTTMRRAFKDAKNVPDLSKWNVSKVEDMEGMFAGSNFNGDISRWNVSNVKNMERMFTLSDFNRDISRWNVSKVNDMRFMFAYSEFKCDLSKWNVKNGTKTIHMFNSCPLEKNLPDWYSEE